MKKLGIVQSYVLVALSRGCVLTAAEIQVELVKMGRRYGAERIDRVCDSLVMRGFIDVPDLHHYCIDWQHSEIKHVLEHAQNLLANSTNKEQGQHE